MSVNYSLNHLQAEGFLKIKMAQLQKDIEIDINIVHSINPHKFYFKLEYGPFPDEIKLEQDLQEYSISEHAPWKDYCPRVNDTVSVYVTTWQKWARAQVDEILVFASAESQYVLWTLDKG